jgi:hypothetical protein
MDLSLQDSLTCLALINQPLLEPLALFTMILVKVCLNK